MTNIKEITLKKKKVHQRICIFSGAAFGLFISYTAFSEKQPLVLLIIIPFLALIIFLNIKFTYFCLNCGSQDYSSFLKAYDYCPKCGEPYEEEEEVKE